MLPVLGSVCFCCIGGSNKHKHDKVAKRRRHHTGSTQAMAYACPYHVTASTPSVFHTGGTQGHLSKHFQGRRLCHTYTCMCCQHPIRLGTGCAMTTGCAAARAPAVDGTWPSLRIGTQVWPVGLAPLQHRLLTHVGPERRTSSCTGADVHRRTSYNSFNGIV